MSESQTSPIAFISDIHGNLEALLAVFEHARAAGYGELLCLGDIVGYGPDPAHCVDLVRERCSVTLLGNHDEALVKGAWGFHEVARRAIDWTRRVMRPTWLTPMRRARWRYISSLPLRYERGEWLLVHGSPRDPTSEYILPKEVQWPGRVRFDELFHHVEGVCFVGHTHVPGLFGEQPSFTPQGAVEDEGVDLAELRTRGKWIVNVGSVGQPRDGDPRACYVGIAEGRLRFHRVEYDWATTQAKIRAIRDLDDALADRLACGM